MKPAMLLKAIISVLLFSSVTAAQAQTARPFKGAWYADGLYVDIDFTERAYLTLTRWTATRVPA